MPIKRANRSESLFYNYKCFYSIILLALVAGDYKFLWVDIGQNGSSSDAQIFRQCELKEAINEGTIGLPPAYPLPQYDRLMPIFYSLWCCIFLDDLVNEALFPVKYDGQAEDLRLQAVSWPTNCREWLASLQTVSSVCWVLLNKSPRWQSQLFWHVCVSITWCICFTLAFRMLSSIKKMTSIMLSWENGEMGPTFRMSTTCLVVTEQRGWPRRRDNISSSISTLRQWLFHGTKE